MAVEDTTRQTGIGASPDQISEGRALHSRRDCRSVKE